MDINLTVIIEALIAASFPAAVTIITAHFQNRASRIRAEEARKLAVKNAARQSILQMCMEDQLNWELFKKFPMNYGRIQDDYLTYHNAGGNGEVTRRVSEYNEWYNGIEKKQAQK